MSEEINGIIRAEILDREITDADMSLINSVGHYIVVRRCYFLRKHVATLNENVLFCDCHFQDSEAILPRLNKQLIACVFTGSTGENRKRHQIRPAITVAGYYSPIMPSKYF